MLTATEPAIVAEDLGVELVEGARARHCRTAVDGPTALDAFLPLRWLAGGQLLTVTHPLTEWRGTLDWWVFTDGQLGQATVIINGYPGEAWPTSGIQGSMEARLTALDRTTEHPVEPPPVTSAAAAHDTQPGGERMSPAVDREGSKWDRAARLLRVATVLHAHPAGISAQAIADQIGVSKRTVYRDLIAMESDAELPIWQDKGKWGLESSVFLPPLALTLPEATTFFLAARVLAKATDEHDSELLSAYVKLAEILPPVLAEHLHATVDAYATTPRNERFTRVLRVLTQGVGRAAGGRDRPTARASTSDKPPRVTRVRPYAIEPSALTRALYLIGFDEGRQARRTFKVERILEASLTPETFEGSSTTIAQELLAAWDVISDEPMVRVVVRFSPEVAARVAETRWHPGQSTEREADGSLVWSASVSGLLEVRIWILGWGADAEVLEPAELRDGVGAELSRAADRYR